MAAPEEDPAYQAFAAQARKCEEFASANPAAYRRRVVWLAFLGYAFPPTVLLALIAILAALAFLYVAGGYHSASLLIGKSALAVAVLIVMVTRAMWPRFGAPDGIRLHRQDAPELFSFVEQVRRKCGKSKLHRIYVTDQMNAGIQQVPRLGPFGWYRNHLIVDLPLVQTLTRQQFAAVLAHEFGHLSGAHGKLDGWVYRTRLLMSRITAALDEKKYLGSWLFRTFYNWFAPHFAAYSFALAREEEYEADRMAARVVSARDSIDSLALVNIADDYMGGVFWTEVWDGVEQQATPPPHIFARLGDALASVGSWDGASTSFNAAVAGTTDYTDTHPCLADRASALGVEPRVPVTGGDSAATLLSGSGAVPAEEFSTQWQDMAAENWAAQRNELEKQRRQLAELDAAADAGILAQDDAMTRGLLADILLSREAALERYEHARALSDGSTPAMFAVGRLLLELGRDDGLALLDQVMELEEDAISPACELVGNYLLAAGRDREAENYQRKWKAHQEMLREGWADRGGVNGDNTFLPHQCDTEKADDIALRILDFKPKGLKTAWLVRKVTKHRIWTPAYFLVCEIGAYKRWTGEMDELQEEVSQTFADHEDLAVLVCDVGDGWLSEKAVAVPGAQIYPRV